MVPSVPTTGKLAENPLQHWNVEEHALKKKYI